jgi:hypothetical protein
VRFDSMGPPYASGRVDVQMPVGCSLDPQAWQCYCRGPAGHAALPIISRTVAGAGKSVLVSLNGAAQVGTGQAQCEQVNFRVNHNCRNFGDNGSRLHGIRAERANIEICLPVRLRLKIEKAKQTCAGDYSAGSEQGAREQL